ncbi:MAG: hypothetical protein KC777_15740 [Cyanobacteria bacterium HKST-UBA02]|nr:hypothetical protein [Cyanobacteria bacterium HKST-UBA02]
MVERFEQSAVSAESHQLTNTNGIGSSSGHLQELQSLNKEQSTAGPSDNLPCLTLDCRPDSGNINDSNATDGGKTAQNGSEAEKAIQKLLANTVESLDTDPIRRPPDKPSDGPSNTDDLLRKPPEKPSDFPVNVGHGDCDNSGDHNKPDGEKPTDRDRPRNVKPGEGVIKVPPGAKPVWF